MTQETKMESELELAKLIRCPVTQSSLSPAPPAVIESLNQRIESGQLVNRVGQGVDLKLEGGWINSDGSLLIPVRGGIVVLISDQTIPLENQANPVEEIGHE